MIDNESTYEDKLTRLPSRRVFDDSLENMVQCTLKQEAPLSLAVIDIDHFGQVNKIHGQDIGDQLLIYLSKHILSHFDISGKIYRFGGDAFAVVMPGISKENAFLKLESCRSTIEAKNFDVEMTITIPDDVHITVSIGLAACPDDAAKAADIIQKANEALYRAKVSGRNRVCLAREEKMITKTSHYQQGQLLGLRRLAERESIGEAVLLREALNDLLRKHNA